ncbi:MAG: nucleotidyltransferase domain-containing protein [Coriobacteriales bacterium]|jgi:predicted nucleotidyltransferase|nr:nucleotidyltransferase domain-containing protein [Coriobacteriales bacterium]
MRYTRTEIARRIKPVAEKYGLPQVYLFGSYARGDADESSDIDLLVETNGSSVLSAFDEGSLFAELRDALNYDIDMLSADALAEHLDLPAKRAFYDTVNQEKVLLYEKC